jgi:hypothetical protein
MFVSSGADLEIPLPLRYCTQTSDASRRLAAILANKCSPLDSRPSLTNTRSVEIILTPLLRMDECNPNTKAVPRRPPQATSGHLKLLKSNQSPRQTSMLLTFEPNVCVSTACSPKPSRSRSPSAERPLASFELLSTAPRAFAITSFSGSGYTLLLV